MDRTPTPTVQPCHCDEPGQHDHGGLTAADRDGLRRRLAAVQHDLDQRGRETHERAAGRLLAAARAMLEQFVSPARGLARDAWQELDEEVTAPGRGASSRPRGGQETGPREPDVPSGELVRVHPQPR